MQGSGGWGHGFHMRAAAMEGAGACMTGAVGEGTRARCGWRQRGLLHCTLTSIMFARVCDPDLVSICRSKSPETEATALVGIRGRSGHVARAKGAARFAPRMSLVRSTFTHTHTHTHTRARARSRTQLFPCMRCCLGAGCASSRTVAFMCHTVELRLAALGQKRRVGRARPRVSIGCWQRGRRHDGI